MLSSPKTLYQLVTQSQPPMPLMLGAATSEDVSADDSHLDCFSWSVLKKTKMRTQLGALYKLIHK